jgi:predicted enzyme related to lactoylglutathione lyase
MVIRTIVHFEIPASDTARLARFYGDVFGWKFQKAPVGELEYWLISTGPQGRSVGGGMYPRMDPADRPRNFVLIEKIDPAIEQFLAAGGTQLVPKMEVPGMGWSFIGADPEGNPIALWEPGRRAPPPRRARPAKPNRRTRRPARRRRRA